jgi:hypothetical protein
MRPKTGIAKSVLVLALLAWSSPSEAQQPAGGDAALSNALLDLFRGRPTTLPPAGGASTGARTPAQPAPGAPPSPGQGASIGGSEALGSLLNKVFKPSERPPAASAPGPAPAAATESRAPSAARAGDAPVLSGVIIAENTRMALLQPPGASSPGLVKIGDTVGAYRLTAVQEDRVKLDGPEGEIVLRLSTGTPSNDRPAAATGAAGPGATSRESTVARPAAPGEPPASTGKRRPDRREVRATDTPATLEGQAPVSGGQDRDARRAEKRNAERRAQRSEAKARAQSRQAR